VQNDERGISGGANKNRATRGSATGGASKNRATRGSATDGPVAEARQEFRAAGARARLSTEEARRWTVFSM
jgi:hypothetical protein